MVLLRHGRGRARRLRSNKLFDGRNQLIFLYRLGQEGRSAFL
jgi:hemin uptake protein HemP